MSAPPDPLQPLTGSDRDPAIGPLAASVKPMAGIALMLGQRAGDGLLGRCDRCPHHLISARI